VVLQRRLPAASLANAQAALQRLLSVQVLTKVLHCSRCKQAKYCSLPDGTLERAQEGVCGADSE
jgi:hypothetical protein